MQPCKIIMQIYSCLIIAGQTVKSAVKRQKAFSKKAQSIFGTVLKVFKTNFVSCYKTYLHNQIVNDISEVLLNIFWHIPNDMFFEI